MEACGANSTQVFAPKPCTARAGFYLLQQGDDCVDVPPPSPAPSPSPSPRPPSPGPHPGPAPHPEFVVLDTLLTPNSTRRLQVDELSFAVNFGWSSWCAFRKSR